MLDTTASKNDRPAHVLLETPPYRMSTRTSHYTPHQQHLSLQRFHQTTLRDYPRTSSKTKDWDLLRSPVKVRIVPSRKFQTHQTLLRDVAPSALGICYATRSLHFLDSPDRMWDHFHLPLGLLHLILDLPVVLLGLLLRREIVLVTVRIPKSG